MTFLSFFKCKIYIYIYNAVISVVVFFSTPERGTDKVSIHVHVYSYM